MFITYLHTEREQPGKGGKQNIQYNPAEFFCFQDVYSIVYTDKQRLLQVEVFSCTSDQVTEIERSRKERERRWLKGSETD